MESQNMQRSMRTSGMSIIEISIVIMIMAIFASLAVGAYAWLSRAKINSSKARLENLKNAIEQYKFDGKQYPNKLEDLISKPADWKQGYYNPEGYVKNESEFLDAWDQPIQYKKNPAGSGKRPFELYSFGPNLEGSPQEEWMHVWDL